MAEKIKKKSRQPYRLWFEFLKTALNFGMKVDRDFYKSWHLNQVKTLTFDKWFKTHSHLFDDYEMDIEIFKGKRRANTILVEIPKNYSVHKIQKEIGSRVSKYINQPNAKFAIKSKQPLRISAFDYMLWSWQLRQLPKYQVRGGLAEIWGALDKKVLASRSQTVKSTKVKRRRLQGEEFKAITISKNIRKADRILKNVCKGQFPGEYSVS